MTACATTGTYTYDRNVQALWIATVANVQAPTAAEVATGVDLQATYNLTDILGWEPDTEKLVSGDWGPFQKQRMGKQKVPDSALMFAAARNGADVRALWDRGDTGYIMLLPSGPYLEQTAAPVHCFSVRVSQITQRQQLRTGGGSLLIASFTQRARMGESVTVVGP